MTAIAALPLACRTLAGMTKSTPPDPLEATSALTRARAALAATPRRWLVTGGAGFIGSHLVEALLRLEQEVVIFDDMSSGRVDNVDDVRARVGAAGVRLRLVVGDVRDANAVEDVARGAAVILHHAALVSVPASVTHPRSAHDVNVTGFLNVLEVARASRARVVYAASSASYGDAPAASSGERGLGRPLSMYAASKTANEAYAAAYAEAYGLETVGLRYFNVFGSRQDPAGAYAAVIPTWIAALVRGDRCQVHGDGQQTRDFCHVANVVAANLLAATTTEPAAFGEAFDIGTGNPTTLLQLHDAIAAVLCEGLPERADLATAVPTFGPPRPGDVRHSRADVSRAREVLGFEPEVGLEQGIDRTISWFLGT